MINKQSQQGFTMIELMIALALGLIIMIAVGQVYIMSIRTASTQQAGSNILDANVFGLQQVERNLRLAGLDMSPVSAGNISSSGIVVDVRNLDGISGFQAAHITATGVGASATSRNGGKSDQLTIQYRAPTDMRDCEGGFVLGPRKATVKRSGGASGGKASQDLALVRGQAVVERYYLADGKNGIELRCDAGRYITDDIVSYDTSDKAVPSEGNLLGADKDRLIGMDGTGALITSGVDDFKVLLAVADGAGVRYISPKAYTQGPKNQAIIGVKLAILAKGLTPIVGADLPKDPSYEMLGENVTLAATTDNKFIRRVYESNSMLRNSRGR